MDTLEELDEIFEQTVSFADELLGSRAFFLFRRRSRAGKDTWAWLERATITAYDPLMLVLAEMLPEKESLLEKAAQIQSEIGNFYKMNYTIFEGRNVNPSALQQREEQYRAFLHQYL